MPAPRLKRSSARFYRRANNSMLAYQVNLVWIMHVEFILFVQHGKRILRCSFALTKISCKFEGIWPMLTY